MSYWVEGPGRKNRGQPRFRLRWSPLDGPELGCPHCGEFWAIDPEFWIMNKWDRCRACLRELHRLNTALRRRNDLGYRERSREQSRRYKAWLRENHPDLVNAYNREVSARARARQRELKAAKAA